MVKFKDFSRPLSVFPALFKANLVFKDFSKQSCIFKYLCEPCPEKKKELTALLSLCFCCYVTVFCVSSLQCPGFVCGL